MPKTKQNTHTIRIALAQINCTVGDLAGNSSKIVFYAQKAATEGADIVAFPELAITGYPPEDLLLKPKFIADNCAALKEIASQINDIVAVIGFVDRKNNQLFNAAAVIYGGKVKGIYHKTQLPNYGVFDEKRYFSSGTKPLVFSYGSFTFGVSICEDIWSDSALLRQQSKKGAQCIININASPYYAGKMAEREGVIRKQVRSCRVPIAYVNLVGGQDELVFDGQSTVVDSNGRVIARAAGFCQELLVADIRVPKNNTLRGADSISVAATIPEKTKAPLARQLVGAPERVSEIYSALVLGVRDYVLKNGFSKVVIGLSGGIDSSLVAALAVDALGKENVTGVFMPSRYSSQESLVDAEGLAKNLGIAFLTMSIEPIYKVCLLTLDPYFTGLSKNIAEENLQARIRGNMLMTFSNKFGWLVLTTGNKSEMSTGYATLYGDMAGGLAVIKDVPKMLVYELSRYRNTRGMVIPENVFIKAPTAELKPDQKDSDTLPEYPLLDSILKAYVEEDKEIEKISVSGVDGQTLQRVLRMVDASEYKRRQAPPGIKITPKAFGRDRRMPITNKYRG